MHKRKAHKAPLLKLWAHRPPVWPMQGPIASLSLSLSLELGGSAGTGVRLEFRQTGALN